MNARTEVHAALMRAGYGAPGADRLLDQVEADAVARGSEKDTRGSAPHQGESTHEHRLPCEWPEVLPCRCARPDRLPEGVVARARQCERIGGFFRCVRYGRATAAEQWGAAA